MPAPTLAQYQDRNFPLLSQELILNVSRSSTIMRLLPMISVDAAGVQWNPVDTLGGVSRTTGAYTTVAAAAQTATTTTKKNRTLVTWYGDVQMDQIQSNNALEVSKQLIGKSTAISRDWDDQIINGDAQAGNATGLGHADIVSATQTIGDANLATFELSIFDQLFRRVNGRSDIIVMHSDHITTLEAKLRAAPGASVLETVELPDPTNGSDETVTFYRYRGRYIVYNDHIAKSQIGGKDVADIYVARLDSGSMRDGLAAITWSGMPGIYTESLGSSQTAVGKLWRVLMHANLVNFEEKSCAKYQNVGFE